MTKDKALAWCSSLKQITSNQTWVVEFTEGGVCFTFTHLDHTYSYLSTIPRFHKLLRYFERITVDRT